MAAVGKKSGHAGMSVPLAGESEIRQQSSATDALTITLASGVTSSVGGDALNIRRNFDEGTSGGTSILRVGYSGTQFFRKVKAISTASSAVTVSASDCGAIFVIPGFSSGATITLPAVAAGLNFEFYVGGLGASGAIKIAAPTTGTMVAFNDSAADSVSYGYSSGVMIGGDLYFFSDGTKWYCVTNPAFSSVAPTSAAGWTIPIIAT